MLKTNSYDKRTPYMSQTKKYPSNAHRQAAYRQRTAHAHEIQRMARGLPQPPAIPTMPGSARWAAMVQQAQLNLDVASAEMQSYYDERSQSWQESDRGEAFVQRMEAINEALESMDDLSSNHGN